MTAEDFAMKSSSRTTMSVLGSPIDVLTPTDAACRVLAWGKLRASRYVCICNVHSVVTATRDTTFAKAIEGADMATPDGAPVAWLMRRLGAVGQQRVSGPDLMWDVCQKAEAETGMFLYGSTEDTLRELQVRLQKAFPKLRISGRYSPPFRLLSDEEHQQVADMINSSGAGIVWVSLGCPKQELWMARHRGQVAAVMIGVGAAFDFHAGKVARAPGWMRRVGLEWLHRLLSEPRRLWRRYLFTNSLFVWHVVRQLVHRVVSSSGGPPAGDR